MRGYRCQLFYAYTFKLGDALCNFIHIFGLMLLAAVWHRGQPRRISFNQYPIKWNFFNNLSQFAGVFKCNNTGKGDLITKLHSRLSHLPSLSKAMENTRSIGLMLFQ